MIETLIVDDEQNVGLALKYMLEKYDYRCTTALNTAEARVRLEERSFELVLLDIIMPGESGLDLLEHLQAAHPDTAVVMISTIDDPRVAAKALDLGAFGYLPKPFDANQVLINLANAVRRRDLEIENRAQRQKLAELVRERTAALIASETRHQALLGALPDPVIAYDPEGRATFVNEAFEKTFGWSGEEVLGRRIDFVPPEEMDKTRDAWARLLREGDSTLETRRLTRDGRVLDVHIRGAATRDADGQMTESVVVIRDVTDRQRALEAVRREKEFREAVLNALSDAISIINVDDLTIAWANQAFFEEVGRSAAEVIGRPCYEVTHGLSRPCQPPADPCPLAVTVKSGCRSTDEHVHFRSDGERYYADISTNPLGDETGRVTRVVHVARDVTDRKRAEQALRESEQRFRTLFDNMRSGVAVYESAPDGRDFIFTDLNRAGERISRVKKTDVLGQAVRKAFPGVEALGLWDVLQRVNGTGLPEHHPAGRYQDGRLTQWVENYVFKLPSGEVVAVYDDVTEEKLAEAQIRAEQERFQTLTDQSPLGVSLIRADGSYAYVNPAFTRIFGYTLADVPDGRTWYRLAFPDPDERRAEIADWKRDIAVQGEGPVITKTSTVRCKDGSTKVVHFRVVKLEAGDHLVLFEDISERKAAEEALRESEDQYRTLVEALPTGFIQADERTELLYLNDRLAEMLGYAPDELKGRQTLDFLDEANRLVLLHQVELRKKGSVQPYELVWTKKDGRRVFTMM
ncbi:MAG: PAS domain S-box protein, partial [Proteobacteria bacterium]|nr:PAS domain S-box protein [Pseudomonadota bacterium]